MAKAKPQHYLIGGLMYVLLFAGSTETIGGGDTNDKCGGEERWEQKVLIDPEASEISGGYEETTIADLLKINTTTKENKYSEGKPRMEIEKHMYKIRHCFITDVLRENDNDLHLVIEDGEGHHMIAEIPDASCPKAKKSDWSGNFEEVRATMLDYANNYRHYMFTITGILFVDRSHRQTGKAPNNVEIHPILELKKEKKIDPILQ